MKLILPLILAVVGAAGGLFGGHMAKPPPPEAEMEARGEGAADGRAAANDEGHMGGAGSAGDGHGGDHGGDHGGGDGGEKSHTEIVGYAPPKAVEIDKGASEYVKLEKQFVVPIIDERRVTAMMVLSVALEVQEGARDAVFEHEPKLRDALLQVLFTHAQSGGFSGVFTQRHLMDDLRGAMTAAVVDVLGPSAYGVLLTNMLRQDQ